MKLSTKNFLNFGMFLSHKVGISPYRPLIIGHVIKDGQEVIPVQVPQVALDEGVIQSQEVLPPWFLIVLVIGYNQKLVSKDGACRIILVTIQRNI